VAGAPDVPCRAQHQGLLHESLQRFEGLGPFQSARHDNHALDILEPKTTDEDREKSKETLLCDR
jgi:hypothetical protein